MSESTQPPANWFTREDESADEHFYAEARFVTHIDQATIFALTDYYRQFLANADAIIDLMSSWVSHYPEELTAHIVTGLGMNEDELAHNRQLTHWAVQNLNRTPVLPFASDTYDRATIAVSIQYLTQPLAVMAEVRRVLKPGGKICIAMSHRLFPTKAISAFVKLPPEERVRLVMFYLTESGFSEVEFSDQSPNGFDPLWIVSGRA
ncbi:MAG: methyltransferase domain-containing protein [Pseudomonadales bacterium]|nr:methyltransferase domain-containing protein [Pseudomonadales bacterium]